MNELTLMLEGIANKVKKLMLNDKIMKDKFYYLEQENISLQDKIDVLNTNIEQLEKKIAQVQASKVLDGNDNMHAKQKVNELLREIEKCYELIKSQENN